MTTQPEYECRNCGSEYSRSDFGTWEKIKCRKCRYELHAIIYRGEERVKAGAKPAQSNKTSQQTTKDANLAGLESLVSAQNRTTHAVRALDLFIFISAISGVLGYAVIGAGASQSVTCALSGSSCDNSALTAMGWVIVAVGFLSALLTGIAELNKSTIGD